MNVNHINPFLESLSSVVSLLFGIEPKIGKIYKKQSPFLDYTVNIKVIGQINGTFALVLSDSTTKNIVSRMMGQTITKIDELSLSAIGELGNMIIGNTCTIYSKHGFYTDISTPDVRKGELDEFKNKNIICIPIFLTKDIGYLDVAVMM